jgi:hypothetical protein
MKTQHVAIAAAGWSFAAVSYAMLETLNDQRSVLTLIFNAAVVIAGSLGVATLISLDNRVGGLGWMGKAGIGFVGVGVAISAAAWGAVNVYLLIQGVGYLLFGIKLLRTHTAPTMSTVIVAGAFFTAPIAFLLADAAQIGTPNEYGDRDAAFALGFVVGATVMAIGLIGWARWLERTTRTTSRTQTIDIGT